MKRKRERIAKMRLKRGVDTSIILLGSSREVYVP
jgi:hypothetical protein